MHFGRLSAFSGKGFAMKKTLKLTETAVMLALGTVLSLVAVVKMPFGGEVTAFSMLPLLVIAYRHRTAWGLFSAFVYAVLQMLLGMNNLTYATSAEAVAAIIIIDYAAAFTVLGLGGIFRSRIKDGGIALALGTFLACLLRYICHVISGCTVWAGVSIPTEEGLIFSLSYNAAYMVPETMLTVAAVYFAGKAFCLTGETVRRVRMDSRSVVNLYACIPLVMSVVAGFVLIFGMLQTEDGFDITAICSADMSGWLLVGGIIAAGVLCFAVIRAVSLKRLQCK